MEDDENTNQSHHNLHAERPLMRYQDYEKIREQLQSEKDKLHDAGLAVYVIGLLLIQFITHNNKFAMLSGIIATFIAFILGLDFGKKRDAHNRIGRKLFSTKKLDYYQKQVDNLPSQVIFYID